MEEFKKALSLLNYMENGEERSYEEHIHELLNFMACYSEQVRESLELYIDLHEDIPETKTEKMPLYKGQIEWTLRDIKKINQDTDLSFFMMVHKGLIQQVLERGIQLIDERIDPWQEIPDSNTTYPRFTKGISTADNKPYYAYTIFDENEQMVHYTNAPPVYIPTHQKSIWDHNNVIL